MVSFCPVFVGCLCCPSLSEGRAVSEELVKRHLVTGLARHGHGGVVYQICLHSSSGAVDSHGTTLQAECGSVWTESFAASYDGRVQLWNEYSLRHACVLAAGWIELVI